MTCHLGDFREYARLRRAISDREAALARTGSANRRAAGGRLAGGPASRRRHPTCPPDAAAGWPSCSTPAPQGGSGDPRPTVLTADRQVRRLSLADFPVPVESVHRLRIPKSFNARNADQPPRPRVDPAQRAPGGPAGPRAAVERPRKRSRRGRRRPRAARTCGPGCGRTRATAARPRGPRALGRAVPPAAPGDRRPASDGSATGPTPSRGPSTGSATCSDELGYLDGDQVTAGRAVGWRRSTPSSTCSRRSACAPASGTAWTPAELAGVVSALVYESRRPTTTPAPAPAARPQPRRAGRDGAALGGPSRTASATTG